MVVSVIGSGGKTTCIEKMAGQAKGEGKKAAIMTTTHMWIPDHYCVLEGQWEDAARMMDKEGIVYFGAKAKIPGKMVFPGEEGYRELCSRADMVLVEADGAKRMPMKLPDWSREPVIPENTEVIFLVFGLSALGRRLGEVCHRWELCQGIWTENDRESPGVKENWIVDKETALFFLKKGYLEELQRRFPEILVVVLLNQADDEERRIAGEWMSAGLREWWGRQKTEQKMECRVVQLR